MSLIKCPECDQEVSDRAQVCVHCGNPLTKDGQPSRGFGLAWGAVTSARTPINVFALAMMACAAVMGVSAAGIQNACALTAFTYTLHIFLAVCGMFFVTLLFCRRNMYHPEDVAKVEEARGKVEWGSRPILAAVLIGVMLTLYAVYQATGSNATTVAACKSYGDSAAQTVQVTNKTGDPIDKP